MDVPVKGDRAKLREDCELGYYTAGGAETERTVTAKEHIITGSDGTVCGRVVSTADSVAGGATCWHCGSAERPADLYQPCHCPGLIHRDCFRRWRQGWIHPRNYFQCPQCLFSYNIERVRPATTESREQIARRYRHAIIKLWAATLLAAVLVVGGIATIAYYADRADKNVPVAVKYMLTGAVSGFPGSNSTAEWRQEFKRPDVFVWPYYTLLGMLFASVGILTAFVFVGCTFDERDRKREGACRCLEDCDCPITVIYCYDPCPGVGGGDCCHHHTHHHSDCGNCSGGGSSDDCAGILAAILLAIVAAIIFSALIVLIMATLQRASLLYDRYTAALLSSAEEDLGERVVLGVEEVFKPDDSVAVSLR